MSFTYDPGSQAPLDTVRWYVADTDAGDPLQHDEEILRVLALQPDTQLAAAVVARQIAQQFARQCTMEIAQEVRIQLSDRAENYLAVAKELEQAANVGTGGGGLVGAYAGGISVADKATAEQNTDRVVPSFTKKLMQTRAERGGTEPWP